jgi:4-amino-4-deoxy-L-arabinose transferase-like glycosyltransferase
MDDSLEKRKDLIKDKLFSWVKDNNDKIFIFVLVMAFIIRFMVFLATKDQAMWFDTAEYLSTAKYWAGVGEMSDIWYYRRGFFWPLFGALFFKLGLGEITIRFFTVLFSTGIVAVSYFLIKNMFNKKYALYASIGLAFSWVMLFFTGRPMTSIPATFFLLLSLLFFWKGYELKQENKFLYLFGIFFALSILTRMQNLIFIPIFFIYIFLKEKFKLFKNKNLWITLAIFAAILLPLVIMYSQHFGNPIVDIMSYIFGVANPDALTVADKTLSTLPVYFFDLPYNLSKPVFYLFLLGIFWFFADLFLGFDKIFKNKKIQKKLLIFLWIVIPFLFLGYLGAPDQRYTMAQHPFLFMIAAIPLFKLGGIVKKHFRLNKKIIAFLILVIFILSFIPSVTLANRLIENKKASYNELKLAGRWIKENSVEGDMVITNSFPQISYYAERKVATFASCYNNPEAHLPECSQEEFEQFLEDVKPKFMVLSAFQGHDQWMIDYPVENSEVWKPLKAFPEYSEQPVLMIYQSNYS